jgi:glucose-6-phosphate-specific signal transduction histidine kinase
MNLPLSLRRAFRGVSPTGIAVIVALCVLNALRRDLTWMFAGETWASLLAVYFGQSLSQAALLFFAVVVVVNLVPARGWRRIALLGAAIVLASRLGDATLRLWPFPSGAPSYSYPWLVVAGTLRWSVLGGLMAGAWLFSRTEAQSAVALHRAELARIDLDRQLAEAHLQVLQAQIEPHFLFNTLAHIRLLYQSDPPLADRVLDNLMRYLAVALPRMRELGSTLGAELDLVEAYLGVQQIRMGARLAFEFDVSESLRALPVPPMMLLTLAENAIKHGLSPLPEGGSIRVAAAMDGERLILEVADTGRGFALSSDTGTGTGLANVRARLAALYGDDATLSLRVNYPHGVSVRFAVPQGRRAAQAVRSA